MVKHEPANKLHYFLLLIFIIIFIWSVINPKDILTWFLEVTPIFIGLIIILLTYNRFQLTNLTYVLITFAGILVLIGGHYTYGEEPLFNWLKNNFHLGRNYYDRFGHFIFGFTTAIIIREFLLRKSPLYKGKLLSLLILSSSLSLSALYEIIEWIVHAISGKSSKYFLGMQGDIWDTQIDMVLFLSGAIISLLLLNKIHDLYLKKLD